MYSRYQGILYCCGPGRPHRVRPCDDQAAREIVSFSARVSRALGSNRLHSLAAN